MLFFFPVLQFVKAADLDNKRFSISLIQNIGLVKNPSKLATLWMTSKMFELKSLCWLYHN